MLLPLTAALSLAATPGCAHELAEGGLAAYSPPRRTLALTVEDGAAIAHVRDRLFVRERRAAQATYRVELPRERGVVVDAWLVTRNGRVASELLAPDEADSRYSDFTHWLQFGRSEHSDAAEQPSRGPPQPMLLVSHLEDAVQVQVAAPCGLSRVEVHLRVALASDPHDDGWRFSLPRTEGVRPARVRVLDRFFHRDGNTVVVERGEDERRGRSALRSLPSADQPGRHVLRAELDLPVRLREERPLATVFVVDRSISFDPDRARGAWRLVERYLDDAPEDSAWALVAMARYPEVIVGPWTPPDEEGARRRASRALAGLENGSDLVAALRVARSIARDAGEREARIVVLSDLELSFSVGDADVVSATAGEGAALTHFVRVTGEGVHGWERRFPHERDHASAAEATGGVLVDATVLEEEGDPTLAAYLLRPTRLERAALIGRLGHERAIDSSLSTVPVDGRSPVLFAEDVLTRGGPSEDLPGVIPEGTGVRLTALPAPPAPAGDLSWSVDGWLWATPVRYPLLPTKATERLLPAIASVNDASEELSDDDVRALAEEAGAVSRVTSRLADPGWRPPVTEGLHGWGCGGCGCGGFGTRCGACTSCGFGNTIGAHPSRAEQLARALARARERCGPSEWSLRVETDDHEVLRVDPADGYGVVERCYAEEVWQLRLAEDEALVPETWAAHHETVVQLPR